MMVHGGDKIDKSDLKPPALYRFLYLFTGESRSASKDGYMEIGATQQRLELSASDPASSAAFYAATLGMTASKEGAELLCKEPDRELRWVRGEPRQRRRATFRMQSEDGFRACRGELCQSGRLRVEAVAENTFTVAGLEGRLLTFTTRSVPIDPAYTSLPAARLQHYAVRSADPQALFMCS